MKIGGNNEFGAPFKPYTHDDEPGGWERMILRDGEHAPYNKRRGEVKSLLNVEVNRFMPNDKHPNSGANISIAFEEITTTGGQYNGDKPERTAGRTISHNFTMMEALKLAKFILEAAAVHTEETREQVINIMNDIRGEL